MSNAYQTFMITCAFILGGLSITQEAEAQEARIITEFRKFLGKASSGNQAMSGMRYEMMKDKICLTDLADDSFTFSYKNDDGKETEIRYTILDRNHNGLTDHILVDYTDESKKDVLIRYRDFGELWTRHATLMSLATHALLDKNPGQSCHCRPYNGIARIQSIKPEIVGPPQDDVKSRMKKSLALLQTRL